MKNTKKALIFAACAVVLVCATMFTTLAYLQASSKTATNTFTIGKVDIKLEETDTKLDTDSDANTNLYKMVPGSATTKDPTVTVLANSEDCYVFVKVVKSGNVDNYITYTIGESWNPVSGADGVYYYKNVVTKATTDTKLDPVLKDNQFTTKTDIKEIAQGDAPQLTFTAYAIQKDNMNDAADAWAKLGVA